MSQKGGQGSESLTTSLDSSNSVSKTGTGGDAPKKGLMNTTAITCLLLWYGFSTITLFVNKHVLSTLQGDPALLGTAQFVVTVVCSSIQMNLPWGNREKESQKEGKPPNFYKSMALVGLMRTGTIFLGLLSLKFIAVSFVETVKSSAPIFTVVVSKVLMGEDTSLPVILSLIPIMSGLALCSAYELSFNIQGFVSALGTNLAECCESVYSTRLISGEKSKYSVTELQFYTSFASVVVQIPLLFVLVDFEQVRAVMSMPMVVGMTVSGLSFHFQTVAAYGLMGFITPVTYSVANTVKRAYLTWTSIIVFGNPITALGALGTIIVTVGVFLYNKAREHETARKLAQKLHATKMNNNTVEMGISRDDESQ